MTLSRILNQFSLEKLGYRYRQLRNLFVDPKKIWEETYKSESEVEFFEGVIAQIGQGDEPTLMEKRLQPNRELAEKITNYLDGEPRSLRILDIGAGPLSTVGTAWDGQPIDLIPLDPFGDKYSELWDKYGHNPPVRTRQGVGEEIDTLFPEAHFDIIHSQNALDHTYQPMVILQKAMTRLKPGGWLMLFHKDNEGKRVYNDFHQWNLTEDDGEFVIWKMGEKYIVKDHLDGVDKVIVERTWNPGLKCDMIHTYIRKQS